MYGNRSSENFIKKVENFMGGNSYEATPLTALKIVSASGIFGEPKYYIGDNKTRISNLIAFLANPILMYIKEDDVDSVEDVMERVIDDALSYDFKATLEYAIHLRDDLNMRLNPQIIFVRAAIHPGRVEFNKQNPKLMREVGNAIINRPDDMKNQLDYYISVNGSKNKLPAVVKRVWTDRLSNVSEYQVAKYKAKGIIDVARIANTRKIRISNPAINTLMETGTFDVSEENQTWEKLSSEGNSWTEILNKTHVGHMALLRNLRNIEQDVKDNNLLDKVAGWLVSGVEKGRQFPFRYYTASKQISSSRFKDALEKCMVEAMKNFPKLSGKTMCLSDNSGSAWGSITSQYGSVHVAEIDNLSSVMTAINSDEGYVGLFGDRLELMKVNSSNNILGLYSKANEIGRETGMATENGIWLFWDNAIKNKEHWDNVFIYSDMQAGHGGLFGINKREYKDYIVNGSYIDVIALVNTYRKKVNPNVNVFTVQTAGYDNSVLPETAYRTAILSGWTGNETLYAKEMIDTWNSEL